MSISYSITESFGRNLAELLSQKIITIYPSFESEKFCKYIEENCVGKTYTQRIELLADQLKVFLPSDYLSSLKILMQILGEENPNETGMFSFYYWLMPVGKFVEKYGLENFDESMKAIAEITKRNTGEYAIRPFIRKYPQKTLTQMKEWACSNNFHLRRLASEGLRPKLPWAPKLDTFVENPQPVFEVLNILKEDNIKFVQKSVANHTIDYHKVNKKEAQRLIQSWEKSTNKQTLWIVNRILKKVKKDFVADPDAPNEDSELKKFFKK